jgi:hypothetical protein
MREAGNPAAYFTLMLTFCCIADLLSPAAPAVYVVEIIP